MDKVPENPKADSKGMVLKHHAIQLVAFQTTELRIQVTGDLSKLDNFGQCAATLESSHTAYNDEEKTIQVRLRSVVTESEDMPLSLHVEVIGLFKVDETMFNRTFVEDWAKTNAPYILYPYVREHVFGLATRIGVKGLLMPLLEIPTIRVTSPT